MLAEKIIERSRMKIILLFLGCLAFVAIGAWLVIAQPESSSRKSNLFGGPVGAGWAAIILFGLFAFMALKQLLFKGPPLLLTAQGYSAKGQASGDGFIPWSDISGFRIYQVQKTKMIIPLLRDPESYGRDKGAAKGMLARMNTKMAGSPLSIGSGVYSVPFDVLLAEFERYHQAHEANAAKFSRYKT